MMALNRRQFGDPVSANAMQRKDAPVGRIPDPNARIARERYTGTRTETHVYEHQPRAGEADVRLTVGRIKPMAVYAYARDDSAWAMDPEEEMQEAYEVGAPKLFGTAYRPGESTVDGLFARKEARHMVGPMLGLAYNDAIRRGDPGLSTPDDLSPYSARLVRKLKGKGVVDEGAYDEDTNDYDFDHAPTSASLHDRSLTVPAWEVKAGSRTTREMLRAGRPRKQRETFTQERLF